MLALTGPAYFRFGHQFTIFWLLLVNIVYITYIKKKNNPRLVVFSNKLFFGLPLYVSVNYLTPDYKAVAVSPLFSQTNPVRDHITADNV